jgi:ketosteroid isomerase-like protein
VKINDPVVVAEVTKLHEEYEEALVSNDVAKLVTFFWESPLALRFGVNENLYGAEAITEFRKRRSPVGLARASSHVQIVTFGDDSAIVTLEFIRNQNGLQRNGRQSQVWRKFADGWKIVSAHVSFMLEFTIDHAAALVNLPIPAALRAGVSDNLERTTKIARGLLDFPLHEDIGPAGVFEP